MDLAVAAGGLLSLAPERLVALVSGMLFAVGAVLLLRGEPNEDDPLRSITAVLAVLALASAVRG